MRGKGKKLCFFVRNQQFIHLANNPQRERRHTLSCINQYLQDYLEVFCVCFIVRFQVTMNYLWFNRTLPQAVVDPRLHHQLLPMYIRIDKDYPMPLAIQEGLQKLGHEVRNISGYAVVQAVARNQDGTLTGKSDPRKSGWAAGY